MTKPDARLRIKLTISAAEHPELYAVLVAVRDVRARTGRLKSLACEGLILERAAVGLVASTPSTSPGSVRGEASPREAGFGIPGAPDPQSDPGDKAAVDAAEDTAGPSGGVLAMLDWEGADDR